MCQGKDTFRALTEDIMKKLGSVQDVFFERLPFLTLNKYGTEERVKRGEGKVGVLVSILLLSILYIFKKAGTSRCGFLESLAHKFTTHSPTISTNMTTSMRT